MAPGQHLSRQGRDMRRASLFLVEDEVLARMMLAQMVEELGHRVAAEAGNIYDAGEYAMTCTFDLAILDINIGGFRVDPVADLIEKRGLPLLFVTGYGKTWLPSLFRKHPVLEKPVSSERLRDVIESLLR
jgi:CheY-like chemotaxis protein